MREVCPRCGLKLDRGEPDYFLGSYVVNFVAAELLVAFGLAVAVAWTWPEVPWDRIEVALYLLVVPAPVLFYPVAKTLWLAIDLTFRPPEPKDFARSAPGGGAGAAEGGDEEPAENRGDRRTEGSAEEPVDRQVERSAEGESGTASAER